MYAQEKVQLTWNTKKGILEASPKSLNKNKKYTFVFNGINPAYYKSKIEATGKDGSTTPPEILGTIGLGVGFEGLNDNDDSLSHFLLKKYQWQADTLNSFFSKSQKFHKKYKKDINTLPIDNIPNGFNTDAKALIKEFAGIDSANLINYISRLIWSQEAIYKFLDNRTQNALGFAEDLSLPSIFVYISSEQKLLETKKDKLINLSKFVQQAAKTKETTISTKTPYINQKDYASVNVALIDRISNDTVFNQTLELPTKNYWNIEFSSGIFINGLVQEAYYLTTDPDDVNSKNIVTEPAPSANVAFGGLAHVSYNFSGKTKFGPAAGAALSPFDGKTRFLAGLSLAQRIGKKGALAFSGGLAWASMDLISTQAEMVGDKFVVPASVEAVPTYKSIEQSWFVGLTYYFEKRD